MTLQDKLYKILIQGGSWKVILVGYVTITDLTRVINNIASRTMQPLLTISIGMLIYLALSYIVFGIFALSDRMEMKKRNTI